MWPHSFARTLLGFTLGDLVHHTAFRINGCFIPDFRQPVDPQEEVHAIMTRVDEIKMLYVCSSHPGMFGMFCLQEWNEGVIDLGMYLDF